MDAYLTKLETEFSSLVKRSPHTNQTCNISNMAQPCGFTSNQYSDTLFQKAYLLKYVQAYELDYINLYEKLKQLSSTLNQKSVLNILSIGCGAGIDLNAAKKVFNNVDVVYNGVDNVHWDDRICTNESGVSYHDYGIDNIDDSIVSSADIVIFPRSITDIPKNSLKSFADRLVMLNKNNFYVLCGHVHSSKSSNSQLNLGSERIDAMMDIIKNAGLQIRLVEDSAPNVTEFINYRDYKVRDMCRNNRCNTGSCNFIAVKNINNKGYHHIGEVSQIV
ncbi:hypothetical protein [Vibrio sp. AND4]|uniref:hypothetical protein n=1 Tax=Vibrio sp. AND4 TaxID=314289 RepID=UPI00117DFA83|nr:hypothetical protein [Vibrio sp. AND4]